MYNLIIDEIYFISNKTEQTVTIKKWKRDIASFVQFQWIKRRVNYDSKRFYRDLHTCTYMEKILTCTDSIQQFVSFCSIRETQFKVILSDWNHSSLCRMPTRTSRCIALIVHFVHRSLSLCLFKSSPASPCSHHLAIANLHLSRLLYAILLLSVSLRHWKETIIAAIIGIVRKL